MKKYLITGLLVWVPLAITVWVLQLVVSTLDKSLLLLPAVLRPSQWLGFQVWGLGALVSILIVLLTGVVASNFLGQRLVRFWESLLSRIPVVKSIYSSVKQVSDTLLGPGGQAFRRALLVQYPRQGSWTIAFQTGVPGGEVTETLGHDFVSVYVPTTPNPTSGFFLMMAKDDVVELDMSVDEALKYIISMGVVVPEHHKRVQLPTESDL
ncbi:MAG: DUF502 domain-containing protein [Rhodocyclaceae bacterium]